MTFFVQAILACLLTVLLILWMRRPAHRFGLVDDPGGRKRHGVAVPLTGGISLTVGFFLALALSLPALSDQLVLLVSMALLALIGVLDDIGEVSPRSKLGVQVLAAVLMTSWAGHFLVHLGDLRAGRQPARPQSSAGAAERAAAHSELWQRTELCLRLQLCAGQDRTAPAAETSTAGQRVAGHAGAERLHPGHQKVPATA